MDRKYLINPLYLTIYALFVFFIVFPIIYILASVFNANLVKNIGELNSDLLFLLIKSILIAFVVSFSSTLFGTVLAFIIYRTKLVFKNIFKLLIIIPLIISPYILAVAWRDLFFNIFNSSDSFSPYVGVILVFITIYTPLSMLIIGNSLSNINSQLEESALLISDFKSTFFNIILPLIKPALISTFILIFIFSISEFSIPAYFGVKVFTTEIFTQFSAFYNHSLAILQSSLLVILCISLLFLEKKHLSDASFISIGVKGTRSKIYSYKFGVYILLIWIMLTVILPFSTLLIQSLQNGTNDLIKALHLMSPTFYNSISLALEGALIIMFIGFVMAYVTSKKNKHNSFGWILLIVFSIPSTIYGISLIKFYNNDSLGLIYSSSIIILIGYIGKFSFIAYKIIENSLKQIPASLDEIAQIQGINKFTRIFKILIPQIAPSLFMAFVISFIFNIGELGTTIMLYPPGTEIMPIKVFTLMANSSESLTSSLSLIVFVVTLIIISIFFLISRLFFKNHFQFNDKSK